jgi:hypothetical protein
MTTTVVLIASVASVTTLVLPARVFWGIYEAYNHTRCGYCGKEGKQKKMYSVDQEQHFCNYDHYRHGTE